MCMYVSMHVFKAVPIPAPSTKSGTMKICSPIYKGAKCLILMYAICSFENTSKLRNEALCEGLCLLLTEVFYCFVFVVFVLFCHFWMIQVLCVKEMGVGCKLVQNLFSSLLGLFP